MRTKKARTPRRPTPRPNQEIAVHMRPSSAPVALLLERDYRAPRGEIGRILHASGEGVLYAITTYAQRLEVHERDAAGHWHLVCSSHHVDGLAPAARPPAARILAHAGALIAEHHRQLELPGVAR